MRATCIEGSARPRFVHSPCRGPFGVACGEVRGEDDAAERDFVAVVKHAVDVRGREMHGLVGAVLEVGAAAGLDDGYIGRHDFILCVRLAKDFGAAGAVVVVRVADEQDFDVSEFESKRLDALADERGRRRKVAVDEDVALRRDDEVGGEVLAADVIQTARRCGRAGMVWSMRRGLARRLEFAGKARGRMLCG